MNNEKRLRYARQIALPEIGSIGQEKLLSAKVLIAGLGGLGSPVVLCLADLVRFFDGDPGFIAALDMIPLTATRGPETGGENNDDREFRVLGANCAIP